MVFDTVTNDQSLNINYLGAGVFQITATGNYYVDWWVSVDGAGLSPIVAFAVQLNGGGDIIGSSPIVTGQVAGNALISVGAVPATVTWSTSPEIPSSSGLPLSRQTS